MLMKEEWKFLQPNSLLRQEDGNNCGVIAFLNIYSILHGKFYDAFPEFDAVRNWLLVNLVTRGDCVEHLTGGKLQIKGAKEPEPIYEDDIIVNIDEASPYRALNNILTDRRQHPAKERKDPEITEEKGEMISGITGENEGINEQEEIRGMKQTQDHGKLKERGGIVEVQEEVRGDSKETKQEKETRKQETITVRPKS